MAHRSCGLHERPTLSLRCFCFRSFTPQALLGYKLLTYIILFFCLGRIMERRIARAMARQAVLLITGIKYSQPQLPTLQIIST
jgi:hypothetical protein